MNENSNNKPLKTSKEEIKKSDMFKKIRIGFILLVLAVIVGYFLWGDEYMFNTDKIFTKYKSLDTDSLYFSNEDSTGITSMDSINETLTDTADGDYIIVDTLVADNDSIIEPKENLKVEEVEPEEDSKSPSISSSDIFKVNTNYGDIVDTLTDEEKELESKKDHLDNDMFMQLLIPTKEKKEAVTKVLTTNDMSYKSILKLLSLLGQDIIINNNNQLSQSMINAIAESDNISNIHIINQKKDVIYHTYEFKAKTFMESILKNLNMDANSIQIIEKEDHSYLSMPIFCSYGRIGFVVLSINRK
jgi:hypothetical protein